MLNQATILNVQRFTLHDGPGIRTEFFLKGCPLRCDWCGNPESFNRKIEVGIYQNKCISTNNCNACSEVCQSFNVLSFLDGKLSTIDHNKCTDCLLCSDHCPSDAIKQWGQSMSVDQCMDIILKDKGFYQRSGGGVTVSGGEPLLQVDFVEDLLKQCHEQGIHTCVESSFYINWDRIEKLLPVTDLFISDVKLMDTQQHRIHTGVFNHKILMNLKKLSKKNKDIILRIPIIPSINDDDNNIKATADFILNEMNGKIKVLQLLSFMRLGEEKYQSLGLSYKMKDLNFDRVKFQQRVSEISDYFNLRGINCTVGTKKNN